MWPNNPIKRKLILGTALLVTSLLVLLAAHSEAVLAQTPEPGAPTDEAPAPTPTGLLDKIVVTRTRTPTATPDVIVMGVEKVASDRIGHNLFPWTVYNRLDEPRHLAPHNPGRLPAWHAADPARTAPGDSTHSHRVRQQVAGSNRSRPQVAGGGFFAPLCHRTAALPWHRSEVPSDRHLLCLGGWHQLAYRLDANRSE